MALSLYNTLTRKKEIFIPLRKEIVQIYSCGPTVYNTVHIGNLRAFLFSDTLQRWFRFGLGYQVAWVMNITDVDDKTIRDSILQYPEMDPKEALRVFTEHYAAIFFQDLETIGVQKNHFLHTPFATHYIENMQSLIQKILDNGYAYIADGSIYLDIKKYKKSFKYGQLVDLTEHEDNALSRVENDEYEKSSAQDFVLWKGKKQGEPYWDFYICLPDETLSTGHVEPVNVPGRPGWHIECSAMSKSLFEHFPFDIHTGGVDLCFPHHENEICQSYAGYNTQTAHFWLHNEHLMIDGKKMSKSLGNFYTLNDLLLKNIDPEIVRFFIVSHHYRTKINMTDASLEMAKNTLSTLRNFVAQIKQNNNEEGSLGALKIDEAMTSFDTAMNDDLNASVAVSHFFSFVKESAKIGIYTPNWNRFISFVERVENVFGIWLFPKPIAIPADILDIVQQREIARSTKDWSASDVLRSILHQKGWQVKDGPDGPVVVPLSL